MEVDNDLIAATPPETALQVRGRSFTAIVIRMRNRADTDFFASLDKLMRQSPRFFLDVPLVVDLVEAEDIQSKAEFVKLARELRARRLHPLGIMNGTPDQGVAARGAGFLTLQGGRATDDFQEAPKRVVSPPAPVPAPDTSADETPRLPEPKATAPEKAGTGESGSSTVLILEPVRSGQRIVAERGDLIVVASVSPGAELVAKGSIHVYGALRGRAMAGSTGDVAARIFCQSLEAELVAIADKYLTWEEMEKAALRLPTQISLQNGELAIETIKQAR